MRDLQQRFFTYVFPKLAAQPDFRCHFFIPDDDDDEEVHLYGAGLHSIECSLRIKKRGGTKTQTIE
jgi:hypothetical protein